METAGSLTGNLLPSWRIVSIVDFRSVYPSILIIKLLISLSVFITTVVHSKRGLGCFQTLRQTGNEVCHLNPWKEGALFCQSLFLRGCWAPQMIPASAYEPFIVCFFKKFLTFTVSHVLKMLFDYPKSCPPPLRKLVCIPLHLHPPLLYYDAVELWITIL